MVRLFTLVELADLFKIWEHQWEETMTKWLGDCIVYGECEFVPRVRSEVVVDRIWE